MAIHSAQFKCRHNAFGVPQNLWHTEGIIAHIGMITTLLRTVVLKAYFFPYIFFMQYLGEVVYFGVISRFVTVLLHILLGVQGRLMRHRSFHRSVLLEHIAAVMRYDPTRVHVLLCHVSSRSSLSRVPLYVSNSVHLTRIHLVLIFNSMAQYKFFKAIHILRTSNEQWYTHFKTPRR